MPYFLSFFISFFAWSSREFKSFVVKRYELGQSISKCGRARPHLEIDCPSSYRLTTKLLNSRDDHAKKEIKKERKYGISWTERWLEGKFWREFCFLRSTRLDRGMNLCWFMIFSSRFFLKNVRDRGKFSFLFFSGRKLRWC